MGRSAGLGSWLSRTTRLPSGTGGGPRQGNPIPQHRPRSKPAPNFGGGAGGSWRTWRGSRPRTQQDKGHCPLSPGPPTSPRLQTPRLWALLAPLRAPALGARRISDDQLSPAAPPCAPRPCPSSVRPPLRESGDKSGGASEPRVALASLTSSPLESLGAALACGSDPGPPPPARARLLRGPGATAPQSRLDSASLGSGSPRHRGWRRLFLQRPPLRPSPDVRRGGG